MSESWVGLNEEDGFVTNSEDSDRRGPNETGDLVDYSDDSHCSQGSGDPDEVSAGEVPDTCDTQHQDQSPCKPEDVSDDEGYEEQYFVNEPARARTLRVRRDVATLAKVVSAGFVAVGLLGSYYVAQIEESTEKIDARMEQLSNSVDETAQVLRLFYDFVQCRGNST